MLYSIVLDCHGAKRLAKTYSPCSNVPNTRRVPGILCCMCRVLSLLNEIMRRPWGKYRGLRCGVLIKLNQLFFLTANIGMLLAVVYSLLLT